MQAISIIGFSNSGKTTLISRLSECLEARGLKVAIAKHTHHELDKPDTDTALLMGPKRTIVGLSNTKDGKGEAMIHWGHPCFLRDLVPLLDADILLVEGGKNIGWLPRILCLRTTPELLTALPEGCKALRAPGAAGGAPEHNGELLARDAVHRREAVFAHALHNAALLRPRNGRGVPLPGRDVGKAAAFRCGAAGSAPEDRGEHGTVQRSLGIEAVVADAIHEALLRHRADIGLRPVAG